MYGGRLLLVSFSWFLSIRFHTTFLLLHEIPKRPIQPSRDTGEGGHRLITRAGRPGQVLLAARRSGRGDQLNNAQEHCSGQDQQFELHPGHQTGVG